MLYWNFINISSYQSYIICKYLAFKKPSIKYSHWYSKTKRFFFYTGKMLPLFPGNRSLRLQKDLNHPHGMKQQSYCCNKELYSCVYVLFIPDVYDFHYLKKMILIDGWEREVLISKVLVQTHSPMAMPHLWAPEVLSRALHSRVRP